MELHYILNLFHPICVIWSFIKVLAVADIFFLDLGKNSKVQCCHDLWKAVKLYRWTCKEQRYSRWMSLNTSNGSAQEKWRRECRQGAVYSNEKEGLWVGSETCHDVCFGDGGTDNKTEGQTENAQMSNPGLAIGTLEGQLSLGWDGLDICSGGRVSSLSKG